MRIWRRRLVVLALVGALAGTVVALLTPGPDRNADKVPPGGSAFGQAQVPREKGVTLLDALAPLIGGTSAPPGGSVSASGSARRTVATRPAASRSRMPLALDRAAPQGLHVGFRGTAPRAPFFQSLRARGWGGVLYDRVNAVDPAQLTALTGEAGVVARSAGQVAPLAAAVQRGGPDRAIRFAGPPRAPATPSDASANRAALMAGRALRKLGITMVLAPSADIGYAGGAWAGRAFSAEPGVVARAAAGAVDGWRAAGVAPVPGHFPGEGAASQDPEEGTATVGLGLNDLRDADLRPFVTIAERTPAVQMSDALYVAFDAVTPATLLPQAVRLLRRTGFDGLVVSGDLTAATTATGDDVGDEAVQALKAGCDLLLVPAEGDAEPAYRAIVRAVRTGQLPESRLANAVRHVLALKHVYGVR